MKYSMIGNIELHYVGGSCLKESLQDQIWLDKHRIKSNHQRLIKSCFEQAKIICRLKEEGYRVPSG